MFYLMIYFVSVMWGLNAPAWKDLVTPGKIFISTLPSLAPFGFYRVWTALMQKWGEIFYGPYHKEIVDPAILTFVHNFGRRLE
jgi:hypothetical protein